MGAVITRSKAWFVGFATAALTAGISELPKVALLRSEQVSYRTSFSRGRSGEEKRILIFMFEFRAGKKPETLRKKKEERAQKRRRRQVGGTQLQVQYSYEYTRRCSYSTV